MSRKISLVALIALLSTGCFRVTVNTGATPSETVIDKPWVLSFVAGLVPPPEIDAKATCPAGVATVVTERSFLNGLVGSLTNSLFTPMHTKVTCAAGAAARR